jgi:hypothetical protein
MSGIFRPRPIGKLDQIAGSGRQGFLLGVAPLQSDHGVDDEGG